MGFFRLEYDGASVNRQTLAGPFGICSLRWVRLNMGLSLTSCPVIQMRRIVGLVLKTEGCGTYKTQPDSTLGMTSLF
jgi:hypothetical protein